MQRLTHTNSLLPTILKRPSTYAFLIALIKALQEARQSLLSQLAKAKAASKSDTPTETEPGLPAEQEIEVANVTQGDGKTLVDKVIVKVLDAAAKQWSHAPTAYGSYRFGLYPGIPTTSHVTQAQTEKVARIVEIIEQTIISDNLEICRRLFVDVLKNTGTSSEKFTQIYNPLIPRLRALLQSKNLDLCAPPFVDLFQIIIGSYLRDVLGKKGQHLNPGLRKIGCGCQDCQPLDKFILDPTTQTTVFRLVQKRRTHLERQIASARDLCSYETIRYGSPHGVKVTKLPEVIQASTWEHRQKAARTFLSSIGTDEVIKKIMGMRYNDVVAAINGTVPFGATNVAGDGSSASTSKAIPSTSATQKADANRPAAMGSSHAGSRIGSSSVASSAQAARTALASAAPPQVAGQKRKSSNVDLGFLDLT
jgi:hypothetical protein